MRAERRRCASMGPRPGGRGEKAPQLSREVAEIASMGPRPGGRGEQEALLERIDHEVLQWGRAPEGAERRPSPACRARLTGFNGAAPRRARRDQLGPRLAGAITELQWGRAPEGAESWVWRPSHGTHLALQWGRAPEGAERTGLALGRAAQRCFNGAAPRRARRDAGRVSAHTPPPSLQWGRAPEGAERAPIELTGGEPPGRRGASGRHFPWESVGGAWLIRF